MSICRRAIELAGRFWEANILYIVVHEASHCIMAITGGGNVNWVNINPLGTGGMTNFYIQGPVILDASVYASGMAVTSLGALIMARKRPLLSLIFAGRTIECSLRLSTGSDITMIHSLIGNWSWLVCAAIVISNIVAAKLAIDHSRVLRKIEGREHGYLNVRPNISYNISGVNKVARDRIYSTEIKV